MPKFELVPIGDAISRFATGKRAKVAKEYIGYIEALAPGQAGKLSPAEGETTAAIRRRLGAAAKLASKDLVVKKIDDEVYFWVRGVEGTGARKRGRQRKTTAG